MNHSAHPPTGLDPDALREQLMELWSCRDLRTLRIVAQQGFSKLSEPLEDLLTILESCPGKQKGRNQTVSGQILSEFHTWMEENPQVKFSSVAEDKAAALQHQALALLTDANPSFADALINIYQLDSCDPAALKQHVLHLQALHCYKEAAVLSMKLNLQNELNVEELCVPLVLQDKLPLVESLVAGHSHLQKQLIVLLDSWCHPNCTMDQIRKRFPHLSLPKHFTSQIQPKLLTKHVLRLANKFKLDQGLCPNALHNRRLDTLRFLMYKTFVEKSMTEENWCDHVQYVVADDVELQVQLVERLEKYCGLQKACQWSLRYNIPKSRLPLRVWETQQSLPPDLQQMLLSQPAQTEEWIPSQSHQQRFYQVPIPRDKVLLVDSLEALQTCRQAVLKEGLTVGVDMEWQPTFGCVSAQQVALIQLAVPDQVFLLDLCASGFGHHPETINFIRTLFAEREILKLGYGMAGGDLKCLSATWQQLLQEPLKLAGMLDLLSVHQKIQRSKVNRTQNGPSEVLVGEDSSEKGLSLLVQQVLGRPLDKTEQMSNWEKRPLRITQIRYAVADAYCLLDVYSVLSSNPAQFGLPADLHSVVSSSSSSVGQSQSGSDKKRKEKQSKQSKRAPGDEECQGAQRVSCTPSDAEKGLLCGEKPSPHRGPRPPLPPQRLRVVCDNMLQGLGRYLRCLGVDVVVLESTDDHRVAAKLAQAEGRVILTCGQPFQSLRSQVGEGRCLSLDCSDKAKDQAVQVLRHFNVRPTPNDIFSRCQACNGDEYVSVPQEHMTRMLKQKGFLPENADDTPQESDQPPDESPAPSATSGLPRYAPQCRWASLSGLDADTLSFPGGAPLQLHTVPPGLLPKIALFYVCTRCGKVFWEGSHYGRVLAMFQEVLQLTGGDDDDDDDEAAAERN
ncbi:unnamed protein product [Ophioblennius macclurei]